MNNLHRGLRRWALCVSAASVLPVVVQASVLPVSFQGSWYIALDNHFYPIDPGAIEVDAGQYALKTTGSLTNCRRSNGQDQVLTDNRLTYANGVRVVYLSATLGGHPLLYRNNASALQLTSASGDIVCDGEVAAPYAPDPIFVGDYE